MSSAPSSPVKASGAKSSVHGEAVPLARSGSMPASANKMCKAAMAVVKRKRFTGRECECCSTSFFVSSEVEMVLCDHCDALMCEECQSNCETHPVCPHTLLDIGCCKCGECSSGKEVFRLCPDCVGGGIKAHTAVKIEGEYAADFMKFICDRFGTSSMKNLMVAFCDQHPDSRKRAMAPLRIKVLDKKGRIGFERFDRHTEEKLELFKCCHNEFVSSSEGEDDDEEEKKNESKEEEDKDKMDKIEEEDEEGEEGGEEGEVNESSLKTEE
jgi:hypothetical protein